MSDDRIRSELRGAGLFGIPGRTVYLALDPGQPLILDREPNNKVDRNAVKCLTILGAPCGYVAREHAAVIAPQLDRGEIWLCKVLALGQYRRAPGRRRAPGYHTILLWRNPPPPLQITYPDQIYTVRKLEKIDK